MSILLDAVSKQKQQSAGVYDPVLTPRPASPLIQRKRGLATKVTILAVAMSFAITGAWGLNTLLSRGHQDVANHKMTSAPSVLPVATIVPEVSKSDVEADTSAMEDFSLAGKVALPRPKPLSSSMVMTEPQLQQPQPMSNQYSQPDTVQQPHLTTASSSNALTIEQLQQLSQQYDQQLQNAYQQSTDTQDVEPIILGANANQRGLQELEALKLQVNMAANEVDFQSVRQERVNQDNNLADAFAAALKDVEYEQSANRDVTEAKLDPIPKPKPQGIPKYGDLPASIQLRIPEFNIVAHVYSTEPSNRWLNVDGQELQQGDMIQGKLTIIEIRPRDIILDIDGQEFKVPAI